MAATGGRGADVILDMVGGDYVERNYAAAAIEGRIVQIAYIQGQKAAIDLRPIMQKRLIHTGSTLRPRSPPEKAVIADALRAKVWPLLEAGRCKPVINSVFPLTEAAEGASAHRQFGACRQDRAHHEIRDFGLKSGPRPLMLAGSAGESVPRPLGTRS